MKPSLLLAGLVLTFAATPAGAQFNANTGDQMVEAIKEGSLGTVQSLTTRDPRALNQRNFEGELPLVVAAGTRSAPLLEYMLANKADPNAVDGKGQLPLIAAVAKGWSEGAGKLVGAGARINGRNKQGETAIIVAVQMRDVRLVRDLMANGADPDIADRIAGFSARDYAKRENRVPELLRLIEAVKPSAR